MTVSYIGIEVVAKDHSPSAAMQQRGHLSHSKSGELEVREDDEVTV